MPRVRIGLTGLACVFLLVLIAAALFGNQRGVRHISPEEPLAELGVAPGGASPVKPPVTMTPLPAEPLAQLGVAPGGGRPGSPATRQPPQGPLAATSAPPQPAAGAAH
jgi:hypothetical protein